MRSRLRPPGPRSAGDGALNLNTEVIRLEMIGERILEDELNKSATWASCGSWAKEMVGRWTLDFIAEGLRFRSQQVRSRIS